MTRKLLFIITFLASTMLAWAQPAYIPANGLASFSDFNGSITFSSYLINPSYVSDRNGNTNSALQLSGNGNLFRQDFIPSSDTAFSIATWFKFDGYSSNYTSGLYTPYLVDCKADWDCFAHGCQPLSMRIVYDGTTAYLEANVNTLDNASVETFYTAGNASTSAIQVNQWTHAALTWDTQTDLLKLYINGVEVATVATPNATIAHLVDTDSYTRIGALDGATASTAYNGAMDELGFWSRALTASEITNIYNSGGSSCPPPTLSFQSWQANQVINVCTTCETPFVTCATSVGLSINNDPSITFGYYHETAGFITSSTALSLDGYNGNTPLPGKYWFEAYNSCDTVVSDTFIVSLYEDFTFTITENGGNLTVNTSSSNPNYTYTYQWFDASFNVVNSSQTYTNAPLGDYIVIVQTQFGCTRFINYQNQPCVQPDVADLIYGVYNLSNATFTDTLTICPGEALSLIGEFLDGTNIQFQWYLNGAPIANADAEIFFEANPQPGNYYSVLSNGCGADTTNTLHVRITPDYTFNATQVGNVITITNLQPPLPIGASSYVDWYSDANLTNLVASSITFTPPAAGTYYGILVVDYNNNYTFNTCEFATGPVVYQPFSCPTVPQVYPQTATICDGDTLFVDGQPLTLADSYTFTLTDVNGCDSIVELELDVIILPVPTITVDSNSLTANAGETLGLDYQWSLNGNPITGADNATLIATTNGTYTVEISLNNSCTSVSSGFEYTGVGINETNLAYNLSIYPNPANNIVNIAAAISGNYTYLVYNATGQKIGAGTFASQTQLDLTNYAAGLYMLHLTDAYGHTAAKRFVKE